MKNFKWITEQWPIIKPFENWQDDWIEIYSFWPKDRPTHAYCSSYDPKTRQPIKEKVMFWKVLMTVIKCWSGKKSDQENSEIMKFMLRSDFVNGKISAHDLKRKDVEPIVYDNAIEAWVGMKHRIGEARVNHEKAKEIEKSTWGNGEKRHKRF